MVGSASGLGRGCGGGGGEDGRGEGLRFTSVMGLLGRVHDGDFVFVRADLLWQGLQLPASLSRILLFSSEIESPNQLRLFTRICILGEKTLRTTSFSLFCQLYSRNGT